MAKRKKSRPEYFIGKNKKYLKVGVPSEFHQLTWCTETAISFINQKRKGPWMLSVTHSILIHHLIHLQNFLKNIILKIYPPLFRNSDILRQKQFSSVRSQN